jgi:outer membrane protein TolC
VVILALAVANPFSGSHAAEQVAGQDLRTVVARALNASPAIRAAEVDLKIAEADLARARAARFLPRFELTWIVGPSPEARGNALLGETDLGSLSAFTRAEATLIQPLFTFGKLKAAEDAASGGIEARDAGLTRARHDLELKVAEAYYGLQLMDALWSLAEEARNEISKARKTVDDALEEDTGDYTFTDLAKIDRFVYDVVENANKVQKGRSLSVSALRMLTGQMESDTGELAPGPLKPVEIEILPIDTYLERASTRPDLRQLQAGIGVRAAQVRAHRSDLYPQIFLGGQLKYSYAPNRDDQESPFARDDFNFLHGGAVVGFRQNLSFGGTAAKVRKARLEHQKLLHLGRLARKGAELEIEKAYRTLREAQSNMLAAEKAVKATRRWFVSARDGFNAGLEESGELLDAVKEYSIIRAKYHGAVFAYNRAWVSLQRATGKSLVD